MSAADIISDLPLLTWRDLIAPPYDVLEVSWENGLAERRWTYVDGSGHDAVGRGSFPLPVRMYFVNTLGPKPPNGAPTWFPDYWNLWKAQLLDGNPGTLNHPVLGELRARVKGAKFEVKASCRSGIVVDVTFVETVEDPSLLNLNGYGAITLPSQALALAADEAVAPFGVVFAPDRPPQLLTTQYGVTFLPGQLFTTIAAVFDAIRFVLFSANVRSSLLLASLMGDVADMYDAVAARNDVMTYAAADALIAFYLACENMRRGMSSSARPTATFFPSAPTTLDAVARDRKNSLKDVMGLNLSLLRKPRIEPGTPVIYYKAA